MGGRVALGTLVLMLYFVLFFFNDTATTEIYTLSLHDALPISHRQHRARRFWRARHADRRPRERHRARSEEHTSELQSRRDIVCRLLLEKKKQELLLGYGVLFAWAHIPGEGLVAGGVGGGPRSAASPDRAAPRARRARCVVFFFNDGAAPEFYPLSPHAALPI